MRESASPFRFTAARIPSPTPSTTEMTRDGRVMDSVATMRLGSKVTMSVAKHMDRPYSPVQMPVIHFTYWIRMG